MAEINFELTVDPSLPSDLEGSVLFEVGLPKKDLPRFGYDHHTEEHSPKDPGALTSLYEDLISGEAMPLRMHLTGIKGPDSVVAASLFMCRDLCLHSKVPELVYCVDLLHRRGDTFGAHVDSSIYLLYSLIQSQLEESNLGKEELGQRLTSAMGWVRDFLFEGPSAYLGRLPKTPKKLDVGTTGFVVAEHDHPSKDAWVELYREGHLRGVIFSGPVKGGTQVLISRKSESVPLDLAKAELLLNQLELVAGSKIKWGGSGNFLCPFDGRTGLPREQILEVLIRC